jgi:hypothetical protein
MKELNDRSMGKAVVSVGRPIEGECVDGEPVSALIRAASHADKQRRIAELEAELARLRRQERTNLEIHERTDQGKSGAMNILLATVKAETE